MKTKLYNYQKEIRDEIIKSNDFSTALFMDMGTGKTLTSLSVFEYLIKNNKVNKLLVVCLKNKINDWLKDISDELYELDFNYEVINFESIWRPKRAEYYDKFVDDKCMVIIDESQKINL